MPGGATRSARLRRGRGVQTLGEAGATGLETATSGVTGPRHREVSRSDSDDPLSVERGVALSPTQTTVVLHLQGFRRSTRSCPCTGGVWEGVARRRDASRVPQVCPECVRVFNGQTTTKCRFAGTLRKPSDGLEPSTPPYHGGFGAGVTRVHTRSLATQFLLQIQLILAEDVRREASRVSFLMCPFRVRALVSASTTVSCRNASRSFNEACRRSRCVSVGSAQHRSRSARRPHSCRRDRERNRARA